MEERYHDPDTMVSMSVIEYEVEYLGKMIQKYKNSPDEKDLYEAKAESLNFAKDQIETNVSTGILTPESYLRQLRKYVQKVQKQAQECEAAHGPTNEHTQRLKKRAGLIQTEISDMEGGMEEAAEEEKKSVPIAKPSEPPAELRDSAPPVKPHNEPDELHDMVQADTQPILLRRKSTLPDAELDDKSQKMLAIIQQRNSDYQDAV